MDTLRIWNALSKPPQGALKKITAGRLRGKSDINPQWRYSAMTELFGPCGLGWKFTIDRLWTEPGDKGVVFAFAQVSLLVKDGDVWSEPIPGIGGHQMVESETKGLHNNDECYKMAVTDALSTSMKMLGVAAEVYLGNYDGSKYEGRGSAGKNKPGSKPPGQPPGSESFGQAPPAEKQAAFTNWTTANGAQQRDYTIKKISDAAQHQDPTQGLGAIKIIATKLGGASHNMDNDQLAAVDAAYTKAEQDLVARCSG